MTKIRRRWVVRVMVVLVVAALLVAGGLAFNSLIDPFDDRPFDPVAWAQLEHERERGPMARDALRHIPNGTPAERVRELLGEPEVALSGYPPDDWGRGVKGFSRWTYWLGSWCGVGPYSFDAAFLIVYFDPNGRVIETEITGG